MKFWQAILLGLCLCGSVQAQEDPKELMGWAGEQAAAEARKQLAQQLPPLGKEAGGADWRGKTLALWRFSRAVNKGQHIPNVRQEIGDCVSFGYGHGCEYAMCVALCVGHQGDFQRAFKPYIYGTSRVQVGGGRINGDGSTGAWAAAAIQKYGVLSAQAADVPQYSGSVARKWGARPGPPEKMLAEGKKHVAEARFVRDWDECCEAIANGWPVPICSGAGFSMQMIEGRLTGRWDRSWSHCMCLIAYDDRPGKEACFCLNSWGPTAHAKLDYYQESGEPPGGFWIKKADVMRILRAGDSYAVSFTGFKRRDLFSVKGADHEGRVGSVERAGVRGESVGGCRTEGHVCGRAGRIVRSGCARNGRDVCCGPTPVGRRGALAALGAFARGGIFACGGGRISTAGDWLPGWLDLQLCGSPPIGVGTAAGFSGECAEGDGASAGDVCGFSRRGGVFGLSEIGVCDAGLVRVPLDGGAAVAGVGTGVAVGEVAGDCEPTGVFGVDFWRLFGWSVWPLAEAVGWALLVVWLIGWWSFSNLLFHLVAEDANDEDPWEVCVLLLVPPVFGWLWPLFVAYLCFVKWKGWKWQ